MVLPVWRTRRYPGLSAAHETCRPSQKKPRIDGVFANRSRSRGYLPAMTGEPGDPEVLLRSCGLRVTQPRLAVAAVLERARVEEAHLTVAEVVERSREILGRVSPQTVYDCLDAMTACGAVRRVDLPGSPRASRPGWTTTTTWCASSAAPSTTSTARRRTRAASALTSGRTRRSTGPRSSTGACASTAPGGGRRRRQALGSGWADDALDELQPISVRLRPSPDTVPPGAAASGSTKETTMARRGAG